MSEKKEKIKTLMISLLNQDGVVSTTMDDSGRQLTIRFDPELYLWMIYMILPGSSGILA